MKINEYKTPFTINKQEKIIINYEDSLYDYMYCNEALITLEQNNTCIKLAHDSLYNNMISFTRSLKKGLNNDLQLHQSLTHDIGFLFNQYSARICGKKLKEPTFLTYIIKNDKSYWPGNNYGLWEYDFITWIYNDNNGNIIFEVTPFYPYMYCERKKEPSYIPYNKWIKTYKPFFIKTISKETAQEWLNQAECIIKTIKENVRKWEEAQK